MYEILHTLTIESKPNAIYRAITEQNGLRAWWTRLTMAEPTVGYVNEFGFGSAFKLCMRIDDLEQDERVEWTCISGHEEWENTRLHFILTPSPDKISTVLQFQHIDWKSNSGVLPQCSYDWAQTLKSLKLYIEKGEGTPS